MSQFMNMDSPHNEVDMVLHSKICVQFFQHMIRTKHTAQVQLALTLIYSDAIRILSRLVLDGSFRQCTPHEETAHSMGVTSSSSNNNTTDSSHMDFSQSSALASIQDLVLVTSFICSLTAQSIKSRSGLVVKGRDGSQRCSTMTPTCALIALAPYWAVVSLVTKHGNLVSPNVFDSASEHQGVDLSKQMTAALTILLTTQHTYQGTKEVSEDIIVRLHHMQSNIYKGNTNVNLSRLFYRLRRALRCQLKNPLLYAVLLTLSVRSDITNKALCLLDAQKDKFVKTTMLNEIKEKIALSDKNSTDIVTIIGRSCPLLALVSDSLVSEVTPLSYAAAYRPPYLTRTADDPLSYTLPLALCKVLCNLCPSALAIADRNGMYPLHYAARRGHSVVMTFLCTNYSYTVPLRDSSGKVPLHHAILSHTHHSEDAIIDLAKIYPISLREQDNGFKVLAYAEKNCAASLHQQLMNIWRTHESAYLLSKALESEDGLILSMEKDSNSSPMSGQELDREQVIAKKFKRTTNKRPRDEDEASTSSRDLTTSGSTDNESTRAFLPSPAQDVSILMQFADSLLMLYRNNAAATSSSAAGNKMINALQYPQENGSDSSLASTPSLPRHVVEGHVATGSSEEEDEDEEESFEYEEEDLAQPHLLNAVAAKRQRILQN